MATKPLLYQGPDEIVLAYGYGLLRVQSCETSMESTQNQIKEIGSDIDVEVISQDEGTTVTVNTNDWGSTDNLAKLLGIFSDGDLNDHTITLEDIRDGMCDIVIKKKEDYRNSDVMRTDVVRGCKVGSYTYTYSADGIAAENYSLRGITNSMVIGQYKDYRCVKGTRTGDTTFTVPIDISSGYTAIQVSVDGVVKYSNKTPGTISIGSYAGGVTTITVTGASFGTNDVISLEYYKDTADDWDTWQTNAGLNTVGMAASLRGQIYPFLAQGAFDHDTAERTLRLQSVEITGDFGLNPKTELGQTSPFHVAPTYPIVVNVTATFYETDLEELTDMLGKNSGSYSWWDDYESDPSTGGYRLLSSMFTGDGNEVTIEIYREREDSIPRTDKTLLKTVIVSGVGLNNKTSSLDVNGDGTLTITMQGTAMTVSGSGNDPNADSTVTFDKIYDI